MMWVIWQLPDGLSKELLSWSHLAEHDQSLEGYTQQITNLSRKNSAKRDTRPLKGHDLTNECSLRGNPKRSFSRKTLECLNKIKNLGGG